MNSKQQKLINAFSKIASVKRYFFLNEDLSVDKWMSEIQTEKLMLLSYQIDNLFHNLNDYLTWEWNYSAVEIDFPKIRETYLFLIDNESEDFLQRKRIRSIRNSILELK